MALSLLAVVGALGTGGEAGFAQEVDSCVRCHRIIDEPRYSDPVRAMEADVHMARGFGCADCHGGNPNVLGKSRAKDRAFGYVGVPRGTGIIEMCGRCHSDPVFMRQYDPDARVDQVVRYRTSVHGQRLFGLRDPKVATCASCHTAHAIRPPSDPASSVHPLVVADTCGGCHADTSYMRPYEIPTDQVDEYHDSVHWAAMVEADDLSAPTCNDCHGNHGAAPPEVASVEFVCGQCHSAQQELFDVSVHRAAFDSLGTPGCAGCHGNHAIHATADVMLGRGDDSVCLACHDLDDEAGAAALHMLSLLDSLKLEVARADSILEEAGEAGMEVSQAQFELEDARSSLIRARATTHAAVVDSVATQVGAGLEVAEASFGRGLDAFRELRVRRLGLAVSSIIILILVGGLVVKIRRLERRRPTTATSRWEEGEDG